MLLPADDDGQLGEVVIPDAEGQREWKLLIPKPDHPFRVDRVTEENRNLRIEYSGADMGVSALLSLIAADEQGNTKRYIRLEHPSVSSGTLNLSREQWGLTEEDRLFLVCENAPGPYLTGLASTPTELIAEEPEIAEELRAAAEEFLGNTINEFDMYKNTNTLEIGIAAGLGYTVIPNLDVNFRFIMGFTNIFEDVDMGPLVGKKEIDVQHMQFSLGATYWFL